MIRWLIALQVLLPVTLRADGDTSLVPAPCGDPSLTPIGETNAPKWQRVEDVQRTACRDVYCVEDCGGDWGDVSPAPWRVKLDLSGSFRCPGRLEKIAVAQSCSGAREVRFISMQATNQGWRSVSHEAATDTPVGNLTCQRVSLSERDVVLCRDEWTQGEIKGTSVCTLSMVHDDVVFDCPMTVTSFGVCEGEHMWHGELTGLTVGKPDPHGRISVTASIAEAELNRRGGDTETLMPCEKATPILEQLPLMHHQVELELDVQGLRVSRRSMETIRAAHPEAIELDDR